MTRPQALVWSLLLLSAGGVLLVYLLRTTSPYLTDGALNLPLVILLFVGLFGVFVGSGVLVALLIHGRWPGLGGGDQRRRPRGDFALRQGILFGIALLAIALLAFLHIIDLIFVLVILLIAALIEAYWQQRQPTPHLRR